MYETAESLGAPPLLLTTIGSRGDTMEDSDVPARLLSCDEHGTIFSKVIARRGGDQ